MRATALVGTLILVPVLLQHLGNAQLGVWLLLLSVGQMLVFADLGLGNGLMTAIAAATGTEQPARLGRTASSGAAALFGVAAILLCIGGIAWLVLPWERWGGASWTTTEWQALAIAVVCLLLSGPAGVGARIQSGLQQGYIASLWQGVGNLLALGAVLVGVWADRGLPMLIALFYGTPVVVMVANSLWYFLRVQPALRPRWAAIDRHTLFNVGRMSGIFFVLQLTLAATMATDNLVLTLVLGVEAVPQYAVPARLFAYIGVGISIFLMPLWPAYAEAIGRGDGDWVRRTFRISLAGAVLAATLLAGALYYWREEILHAWVGESFPIDAGVIGALAIWTVFESAGIAVAMLLNGGQCLRLQLGVAAALAVASLPCRMALLAWLGPAGLPAGTVIAYILTTAVPLAVFLPRYLRGLPGRNRMVGMVG